ncbi:MAG: C39 family peptidase [bacterium]|nr:C39 family peptidase [bacterium]
MPKKIDIAYNSQRDNPGLAGLPGSAQCGYTAAAMMLSAFLPDAATDAFITYLIKRMEPAYGKATLAEKILRKVPWARGRLGIYGDAYAVACEEILRERGVNARIVWTPGGGSQATLEAAIDQGSPAMLSTMITPSGHYICVVGYDAGHWICHDPYGDGHRGYRSHPDGAFVKYPRTWLEARAVRADPTKRGLRFMYVLRE